MKQLADFTKKRCPIPLKTLGRECYLADAVSPRSEGVLQCVLPSSASSPAQPSRVLRRSGNSASLPFRGGGGVTRLRDLSTAWGNATDCGLSRPAPRGV